MTGDPGLTSIPPLFKSWAESLVNNEKTVSLAKLKTQNYHRTEMEFKSELKPDYMPKIESATVFSQVLFKEVYDSADHNWFKNDEDLIEAFFD